MLRSPAWLDTNRAQHHAIADALSAHDAVAAEAAPRVHLRLPYSEVAVGLYAKLVVRS